MIALSGHGLGSASNAQIERMSGKWCYNKNRKSGVKETK